ncbi:MAG: ABC transporter ATP-binding protein [Brevundimonas sp.]|uniref:ABC transporter ATP-binding protein n=1 Tax=Brevundimonas sp. TaxID=1871086 RepID=UPI002ABACF25|nr:ABC transporter ATP-binding protein [Brevundimonas sp.]MDZ4113568.1 ABC transporter ATP-binding protein [Brevundimonas sp.]
MTPLVSAQGVSKRYCRDTRRALAYGVRDIWRDFPRRRQARADLRKGEFWALDNVDFVVERGEALAVMGANGAGKTTLMRLVAGILEPDGGTVAISGRVGGVIELGGDLDPLLTGRENAAMGLRWRGVKSAQLPELIADVQDFAELDEEFDAPVQTFSSGMRSRLGFAITTRVPCDLLLLDEVLAVGDLRFQRKCLRHIRQHLNGGGGMIFVSHNVFQVQTVCSRAMVLDHGRTAFSGDVAPALERLFAAQAEKAGDRGERIVDRAHPGILDLTVSTDGADVRPGGPVAIELALTMPHAMRAQCVISIWSRDLTVCIAQLADSAVEELPAGESRHICTISSSPLAVGTYAVRAAVIDPDVSYPMATFGFDETPVWLKVRAEVDRRTMMGVARGVLVEIEHGWQRG